MRSLLAASLVVVAAAVACGSATGGNLRTGLYGTVTTGPLIPICTTNTLCQGPAARVLLVFSRKGAVVAGTRTGDDGSYRVALKPGRYVVRVAGTKFGVRPGTATVPKNKKKKEGFLRIDFFVDTGIR